MTETQSPKFRWWQKALLAFGLLAGLGLLTFWFLTTATFWQQVGWRLVAAVQDRVNAEVSAGKISGNLLTGMVFSDVKISRPQGDLIRVKELEVSLSLLSLFKLQPVIRTLAFRQPEVFLRQDADGSWNYANFLKPTPPPPFSQIHLSGIQIQNGLIQVDRPGQQQTFQDMNARLNLTIQDPGRPRQAVLIHQASIGLTSPPYPSLQADFALTYSTEEIQFQRTEITLADIPVLSLHGKVVNLVDTPALDLSLNLPELSGPQLRQLWPEWSPEFSARAGLAIQGPVDHLKVTGSGALHNCQWQVAGSWQTSAAARPEFDLTVNFQNLTAPLLAALYPGIRQVECFTHLNGALTVTGHGLTWPPDNLQARLELRPFSYGQAKIEAAALTLKSLKDLQTLVLKLQGNFGRLETEVSGQLLQPLLSRTNTTGEIKISAGDFNPALLLGDKAPQGSLTAKFAGNFQLPPVFDKCQTRLSGKLQASGTLLQYAFQEFSLTGALEDGELQLNPARLLMHNLRAEAQGRISLANADLKLSLDLLPPGPWPLLPPDLKGQFRTTGTIKGDWQSLAYQFDLQGKNLSWQQLGLASLQGKTSGTASRDTFRISSFDILAQNLTTPVGRLGQIHAIGQTRGSDLVFDLKTPKSQGQAGALAGTASWEQGATLIKITRFQWGLPKFQVASVQPVTVSIGPGRFEISPLRLQYQKALFSLSGKLTNEVVSLQAKLENLRVEDIAKFLPQISDVKGVIDAQADVAGPAGAPSVKVQMNVASVQIDKFSIASFQSNWLYRDNLLTLNGRVQEKSDKAAIVWQGTSPLTLSLLPWSWRLPESGLQLRLWSDNVNMSLLAVLIPGVSASEGPLNLQAQVTGSFLHPLFAGTLRYGPGSLTIQPSGAPLAIEAGELRLQGNRLILPRLIFHSGDGTGEITGGASLANLHLQDVQLNLRASNLLIIQRDGSRAVANGQVSLKGSWPDFRTDGRLTVNDGQFRLSFFRSPQNSDIVLLPRESPPLPPVRLLSRPPAS